MFSVYKDEVAQQPANSPFVAMQADETNDVSSKSQMVTLLRYMVRGNKVPTLSAVIFLSLCQKWIFYVAYCKNSTLMWLE